MIEEKSAFAAYAYHPSLGAEVARGRIVFEGWRLRFESQPVTLEIPLIRLQIERGAAKDGRICFSDPERPDWEIYTYEAEILGHSRLGQQAHTRNQIQALQGGRELKRRLIITFSFLAAFALVAVVGSILTGVMVRSLVASIPVAWEQALGDGLLDEVKQDETFVQDTKLQATLDRAVGPLVKVLPRTSREFKFYVVKDPFPNAFALPGGHVLVNTGLLELAEKPEEIAGVVAHEIAHVTERHGFRKIISSTGPYLIFRIFAGGGSGLLGLLGDSSQLLVRQSFSQEYELEADAVGWQYLVAAHIDPRGLADMLKKLRAEQDKLKGLEWEIRAFSSHPPTEKRLQRLEEKWRKLKDKSGFIDFRGEGPGGSQ